MYFQSESQQVTLWKLTNYIERQKTQNSQCNIEEEQSWTNTAYFKICYSVVLEKEQTYRSKKQNKECRNTTTQI